MKTLAQLLGAAVVLLISTILFGQSSSDSEAFCKSDPRPEVRAYCHDLAIFQDDVNKLKSGDIGAYREDLNQLDLSRAAATDKFITAISPSLIAHAALSTTAASSSALEAAGQARPDRQLSPPNSASGTTSLISKTGSAELLALSLDSGALTQSVNGTTTTLNTNADQLFRLVTGSDPDCTVNCTSLGWFENHVLNQTNISGTLNLAQPSSKNIPTSGQASGSNSTSVPSTTLPSSVGRLSGITAKYEILNKFDPRSSKFKQEWKTAIQSSSLAAAAKNLGDATDKVRIILQANGASAIDKGDALKAAESDPSGKALSDYFASYFEAASQKDLMDKNLAVDVAQAMQQRAVYRQAWFDALHAAVGTLLTLEYDYNQPVNQPKTSIGKLIYAYNFQNLGMLTCNGSVSFYNDAPPVGAKYGRLYYGQVSTQYDRTISGKDSTIQTQMSLAGYWQYQPHPSVLNIPAGSTVPGTDISVPNGTQEFVGTAGSLWVTQAKLTIKAAGGINLPIAVSWSNKTDLLQGNKIGAQVGLSYNFSSVAGLFTGGSH